MKTRKLEPTLIVAIVSAVIAFCAMNVVAQDPQTQTLAPQPTDPIEQLRLTPEQRQQIRAVREETKPERALINRRLREANAALQQALDVDNPDDTLIEQRIREVGAAQTASMRMRIQMEVRIRRILTPEQLATLRAIRNQIQNERPGRDVLRPNQSNGLAPLFPRRNVPPRRPPRP